MDISAYPAIVTFESGAKALNELGVCPGMTADALRYAARTRQDWIYGEPGSGKPHSYERIANARVMDLKVLVDYFIKHPSPTGVRGPDKKPRQPRRPS